MQVRASAARPIPNFCTSELRSTRLTAIDSLGVSRRNYVHEILRRLRKGENPYPLRTDESRWWSDWFAISAVRDPMDVLSVEHMWVLLLDCLNEGYSKYCKSIYI